MKKISFCFLLFFYSHSLLANNFFDEARSDALSPFEGKALTILEIGAGATLLATIFEENLKDKLQSDVFSDRPLKTTSKIGDFLGKTTPNIAYVLLMTGDYYFTKEKLSLNRAILMTKATIYSGALTNIVKRVVRENRPNGGKYSFPSGHTTSAFAFASVITMEHSLPLGIAANGMAAFVGFSRMNDDAHYLQDVIAGAVVGTMYGVGLYYAQKDRQKNENSNEAVSIIFPINKGLAGSLVVSF